ncbi:30S ribosomal protein S10 [Candidatus Woesearchaeota archaeon]|nr:30S ribosomal protein S10 [Candidatus Woesearchaeota archaeon]
MGKARISLASPNIKKLNEICSRIKEISEKTGVSMSGPIPIPNKDLKVQVRKSPGGDGKASYDRYEMRIHKRLIDLGVDERALRLIMRVHIPEEVNISVEMMD